MTKEVHDTPGIYNLEELERFDQRQAWTHRFGSDLQENVMPVGSNEEVTFSRTLTRQPLGGRAAAEEALIGAVVMSGEAPMDYRKPFRDLRSSIIIASNGMNRLPKYIDSSYVAETLSNAVKQVQELEAQEMKITVSRAAGYIAARSNLWVVTDSIELHEEQSVTKVNVAKLIGIGVSDADRAVPVVVGKNQKISKLDQINKLRSVNWGNFRVLTVVKSRLAAPENQRS